MGGIDGWKTRFAGAALVLACMTGTTAARAEGDAEQTFQLGLAAMKKKDFVTACEAFARSNKDDASPGTQINLALCFEKRKLWASAWTWYRSAMTLAHVRGQKDRETLAEESADKLLPQVHYVLIVTKEPLTELKVKRDGDEVTTTLNGKEVPVPVDPGERTFEVSAKGKKPWTGSMKFADNGKTDRLEVPILEALPVAPPPPVAASAGTDVSDYRPPATGHDGSGQRVAGIIVGSTGILAGLASVGMFVLANHTASKRDEFRTTAKNPPAGDTKDYNQAADSQASATDNNRLIGYILVAGGGVLLGVGTVLFLTAPKAQKTGITRLLPTFAPGHAGLSLGGAF